MEAAGSAAENAASDVDDLNDAYANIEKTVNRLAGFDQITKLSGSSSSLMGALFDTEELSDISGALADITDSADDVRNAFDFRQIDWSVIPDKLKDVIHTVGNTLRDIDWNALGEGAGEIINAIGDELSQIDWEEIHTSLKNWLGTIDWQNVFTVVGNGLELAVDLGISLAEDIIGGLADWAEGEDWEEHFRVIGTGFENVFNSSLRLVDAILGTHLAQWHKDISDTFYDLGVNIQLSLDPTDEGLKVLDEFERKNGKSAYMSFLEKYKSGEDPLEAFREIYDTADMRKGFFAVSLHSSIKDIKEWSDLTEQTLKNMLDMAQVMSQSSFSRNSTAMDKLIDNDPTILDTLWRDEQALRSRVLPSSESIEPLIKSASFSAGALPEPLSEAQLHSAIDRALSGAGRHRDSAAPTVNVYIDDIRQEDTRTIVTGGLE